MAICTLPGAPWAAKTASADASEPDAFGGPLAYSYDFVGGRTIIHARGRIGLNEAAAFNAWRRGLSPDTSNAMRVGLITLALDSPGGSIDGASHIMQWVKDNQIDTVVPNGAVCASACVMIWGAGVHKSAGETAKIGVHGASTTVASNDDEKAAIEALGTLAVARALAEEKAPAAVIAAVATTTSSDIHWLTSADVVDWSATILDKDGNPEN
jgi:membrane-bound ClpP family serine protease